MDNFTVGVVVFPGSNCDRDVSWALEGCLDIRTKYLWHESSDLSDVDAIVLPGGFSYGDYLRCGAIARFSPLINALKNDVASVRLWSSSSLAEIGNVSLENAQLAAEQLLISLKIDNEPGVRSNCIWSLCRLYEKLNNTFLESFIDECTKIALFDKEPSVMEEAKTALDSMGMQGFYN